jgi:hypothetical protein
MNTGDAETNGSEPTVIFSADAGTAKKSAKAASVARVRLPFIGVPPDVSDLAGC